MPRFVLLALAAFASFAAGGCSRTSVDAKKVDPTAASPAPRSDLLPADDPVWQGLERREIQLDQKLLVIKGSKGVIGCPYLDVSAFEKFGEACAIVPAIDTAGMLDSKVTAVTTKGKELGIEVGMSGREALEKIR